MDRFTDRLDELYRSFSSLNSREQREEALEALSFAFQKMSATLESRDEVLTLEATTLIQAQYGGDEWINEPSTSYNTNEYVDDNNEEIVEEEEYIEEDEYIEEEEEDVNDVPISLLSYYEQNTSNNELNEGKSVRQERNDNDDDDDEIQRKKRRIDDDYVEENEESDESAPISCIICGLLINGLDQYIYHMKSNHELIDENEEWIDEIENKDNKEKKIYQCATCGIITANRKTLWRHGRTSGHDTIVKEMKRRRYCSQCEYSTDNRYNLERHRNRRHPHIIHIECPICLIPFSTMNSFLSHHSMNHSSISKLSCSKCSKEFTRITNLRRHQRLVHQNERLHSCSNCMKTFQSPWHLRRHQMNTCINE